MSPWDLHGFSSASSWLTFSFYAPCYMTAATFHRGWPLQGGPCSTTALFSHWGSRYRCRVGGIEHVLHGAGRAVAVPHLGWQKHSTISRCFNRDLSPTLIQVVSHSNEKVAIPLSHQSIMDWSGKPVGRGHWLSHPSWGPASSFCTRTHKLYSRPWMEMMQNLNCGRNWVRYMHST